HYSILTLIPYPWRWDASPQGWKKMFYLDPSIRLLSIGARAKAPTGHAG
ncbi:MAG TPA: M23 family peptidase, partial [Gammaproteobacteria bacterium]|nr:M23 family peptidase [Gammaproteobacteria bacterium]